MLYFANPSSGRTREIMLDGLIGCIATPFQGNSVEDFPVWCADNGCYGRGYPGDVEYLGWLARRQHIADRCRFATAPDVLYDAKATLVRSLPFMPVIRGLGYPAALVAQDGLEDLRVPWDAFDVLFIGGGTDWKLGPGARDLAGQAVALGKQVHMGRVNSYKRLAYADSIGCSTADGTFLKFAPDHNVPRMLRWLEKMEKGA